jgi:hypothetical protein
VILIYPVRKRNSGITYEAGLGTLEVPPRKLGSIAWKRMDSKLDAMHPREASRKRYVGRTVGKAEPHFNCLRCSRESEHLSAAAIPTTTEWSVFLDFLGPVPTASDRCPQPRRHGHVARQDYRQPGEVMPS